jgi:cytochrome c
VKEKVSSSEKVVKAVEPVKPAVVEAVVDTKKGETLISKSDCFACHKINEKLLGPSYKDVANKYANTKANVNYLVAKIKNGGSGVWGAIPMSPHPALSDDDAAAMVQYILSLN